ncbi:sigma-70 family RNA polymerase sigma factor [Actinomadura sp. KC06]|uniref:sigma-70 family RNA polymerase sigma factor n=1 Tax=Actinomadura sp. KC06 TaxID=2530369 RepID=UPI001404758A|nr:sigma-70 family RNA polymerase sigma factor [Actinomadura sp. KC06]
MRQDFLDFVDAEYHLVVRLVMRDGADLADAQDAAQQAFLQGWRRVEDGRWGEIVHPRAWIREVAFRHHRAQCRARSQTPLGPDVDFPEPGPGHAELTGEARDVVAFLQRLDPDCRAVIAFDLDGIPPGAIATTLGITEQKVRDLRKKARKQLKKSLPASAYREGRSEQ